MLMLFLLIRIISVIAILALCYRQTKSATREAQLTSKLQETWVVFSLSLACAALDRAHTIAFRAVHSYCRDFNTWGGCRPGLVSSFQGPVVLSNQVRIFSRQHFITSFRLNRTAPGFLIHTARLIARARPTLPEYTARTSLQRNAAASILITTTATASKIASKT